MDLFLEVVDDGNLIRAKSCFSLSLFLPSPADLFFICVLRLSTPLSIPLNPSTSSSSFSYFILFPDLLHASFIPVCLSSFPRFNQRDRRQDASLSPSIPQRQLERWKTWENGKEIQLDYFVWSSWDSLVSSPFFLCITKFYSQTVSFRASKTRNVERTAFSEKIRRKTFIK